MVGDHMGILGAVVLLCFWRSALPDLRPHRSPGKLPKVIEFNCIIIVLVTLYVHNVVYTGASQMNLFLHFNLFPRAPSPTCARAGPE